MATTYHARHVKTVQLALGLWASCFTIGCGPSPERVTSTVFEALTAGNFSTLERYIDPSYMDGLGNREQLLKDLRALNQTYSRREFQLSDWSLTRSPLSKAEVTAKTLVQVNLAGLGPGVKAEGLIELEFIRNGHFRIRSGLLTAVRDVLDTMKARRAALEANSTDGIAPLIHPQYREGNANRHRLLKSLKSRMQDRKIRLEPIAYNIQLRPHLVHVDEYYRISIDDQALKPAVARLTLASSAGRLRIKAGLGD